MRLPRSAIKRKRGCRICGASTLPCEGIMDREILAQHLLTATERTRDFATQYVTNELPSSCRCLSSIGLAPVDRVRTDGGPFPAVSHRFHQHIAACLGPHGV